MSVTRFGYVGGLLLALVLAPSVAAQLAVEARVGGSVGNHVPAAAGLETVPGLSFSGALDYSVFRYGSLYASVSRASFGCEEGFCTGREATVVTQGYGAGIRFAPSRLPWVRFGLVRYSATVETASRSDAIPGRLGYELGAGLRVLIGERVRILPGIYYRTQSGEDRTTILGADIGLRLVL